MKKQLERLYNRFAPMTFSVALGILKSREEAEDVVHDIFAFKVPRMLENEKSCTNEQWGKLLAVSTKNLCIDRYRRKNAFPELSYTDDHGVQKEHDHDTIFDIKRIMEDLECKYRHVLTLKYVWALTWGEVAKKLGVSEQGARKRARKAMDLVRNPIEVSILLDKVPKGEVIITSSADYEPGLCIFRCYYPLILYISLTIIHSTKGFSYDQVHSSTDYACYFCPNASWGSPATN